MKIAAAHATNTLRAYWPNYHLCPGYVIHVANIVPTDQIISEIVR